MKEVKLNIGSLLVRVEYLQYASGYNEKYYKIESCGDSCCIYYPFDIIQEIYHEEEDYYEYTLGYFESEEYGGNFAEAFSWTSEYGADSIFGEF